MRANKSKATTNCGGAIPRGSDDGIEYPCSDIFQRLKMNPDDPALIRYQADILKGYGDLSNAANLYSKAANLLLKEGRIPAAIALKLMQWRISSPTKTDVRDFMLKLNQEAAENQPVQAFFCHLNIQESFTLYSSFEMIAFEPDHEILGVGDLENHLYFVVSGILRGSLNYKVDGEETSYRDQTYYLHQNDYFGDIHPFDSVKKSTSCIESKTQVELIRISREKLRKICAIYPRIEHRIMDLLKVQSGSCTDNSPQDKRKVRRIPSKLHLGIEILLNGSQHTSIYLTGHTKDVSIGGLCIILDEAGFTSSSEISSLEYSLKLSKVQVNFTVEELKVSIPGTIVWIDTVSNGRKKSVALGIKFDKMSPKLRGIMMMFFNSFSKN